MWNSPKGFGFLSRDDGGEDMFAHITQTPEEFDELSRGTRVSFEIGPASRNPTKNEAKNIHIIA
jgi:CspA family cold shock protein